MNDIQILRKSELCGRQFTVYGTAENPLFLAKEVAEIIEHTNPTTMLQGVDEDEKVMGRTKDCLGRDNVANFLTEDGLYEVLMQSRKPIAKTFKKGVKQILHEVRTNGGYLATTTEDTPELIMAKALKLADATIQRVQEQNRLLAEQNAEMKPKADFAAAILASKGSILIGELAKILKQNGIEMGANRLFRWMRDNHYLGSKGEYYNLPNQRYMEMGLFELKKSTHTENEIIVTTTTTKVTPKGQQYFINLFLNKKAA